MSKSARVYLVGAGPGDPELLTMKAYRLLQSADTVVYDRLVSDEILASVSPAARLVFVGKASGHHSLAQHEINELLVRLTVDGGTVVRLKGGDPFIFGRGSEEALYLKKHSVAFEIVPGITAAQACSAYSGVPLTHRGVARSVQYITGHWRDGDSIALMPETLADQQQTLVVYMGLANLPLVVESVLAAGRPASTPVAVVERGTTNEHRQIIARLDSVINTVRNQNIQPPSLVIIGDVVAMADELAWFDPSAAEATFHQGCIDTTLVANRMAQQ